MTGPLTDAIRSLIARPPGSGSADPPDASHSTDAAHPPAPLARVARAWADAVLGGHHASDVTVALLDPDAPVRRPVYRPLGWYALLRTYQLRQHPIASTLQAA